LFSGIYQILHTPFDDNGAIDWASYERQIDYCLRVSAHGLVAPAMASEFFSLSDAERFASVEFVLKTIAKRVPVLIGVQGITQSIALEFGEHAAKHGADGLMSMPPYLRKAPNPEVESYYRALAGLELPLMIQNAPAPVGSPIGAEALAKLMQQEKHIRYIKEEAPPILQRITRIIDLAGDACEGVFGGANGIYLIDELERGAVGNMPAGGLLDVQVKIYEMVMRGDKAGADALQLRLLPLLNYASMYGVTFHKYVLWRRGVLTSPHARDPQQTKLDAEDKRQIARYWPLIEAETHPDYPLS